MNKTIVVVACCGKKLSKRSRASDLYQSDLFKKACSYAERHGDDWLILSARYGVVHRSGFIEPYNVSLKDMHVHARRSWYDYVEHKMKRFKDDNLIVLAGNMYCGWISDLFPNVSRPLKGMGIGEQLSFLKRN